MGPKMFARNRLATCALGLILLGVMMDSTAVTSTAKAPEEVSAEDIAHVEAVLRTLESQQKNKRFVGFTAQWFLVLKMFKKIEVSFSRTKAREHLQSKHRAIL